MTSSSPAPNVANSPATIWQIDIFPASGQPDRIAGKAIEEAGYLGFGDDLQIRASRTFLVQAPIDLAAAESIAHRLLVEPVVETCRVAEVGSAALSEVEPPFATLANVMLLPGVTDAQAESAREAMSVLGYEVDAVRTMNRFWISPLPDDQQETLFRKVLSNDSIETIVQGPLHIDRLDLGQTYELDVQHVELNGVEDGALLEISKQYQLSLSVVEMQTIRTWFQSQDRTPTRIELETVAQTWSEHCSHKTLAGRIEYSDDSGTRHFENMLKETIFAATVQIREDLGDDDWCVSVFCDNAGIVRFDDDHNVAFKVETHNRPSALEPYGGANTGIGGVIRDTLGTGLGAKPVCSTDVFCFAPPQTPHHELPPGVMHPHLIMNGVVAGVRDYGNRMGIPTVNGAVCFDDRYVGNPLVFCGNVGVLPQDKSFKEPQPNDLIVSIGGRTGRDGIHGATFSSAELTESSDITSGGAVQIGNAITEKMLMDVMLAARDRELYTAVTDCGAGGYSSAVGEMGEEIGAEVWLEKVPLKYDGLSHTEIWISEAQERMVFSIPESNWEEFDSLCAAESVEATIIGRFAPGGQLRLMYDGTLVGDMSMAFLHDGRPPIIRQATFDPPKQGEFTFDAGAASDLTACLENILSSLNVCSKQSIIQQYDHEVQGGSVVKPLVGVENDGPSDAAVIRPVLSSRRGLVIGCGINPHFGDIDPYHMAASAIDEAIRNCVAVGADPSRIAILDNFCWGHTDRPETLGSLVRAALACHDLSIVMQTPFISGKDSLHNEFSYTDDNGNRQTISIPATLLISAMGQVADVATCLTMDLKQTGNLIYLIGDTGNHLGGSHLGLVTGGSGGAVPTVDAAKAKATFATVHAAIESRLIRSCHDLSEGGLAAAIAEMAFAGGLGASIDVSEIAVPDASPGADIVRLFSESNTRFVVEVEPVHESALLATLADVSHCRIGVVTEDQTVTISNGNQTLIDAANERLKSAWQHPLSS